MLIPIQRVCVEAWQEWGGVGVHASAEPRAVVVQEEERCWAFDSSGVEISLDSPFGSSGRLDTGARSRAPQEGLSSFS